MDDKYINTLKTASSKPHTRTTVTITHPHHPLNGLKLEVVTGSRNPQSSIVVRTPDGATIRIRKEWTDYEDSPDERPAEPFHLCSLEGLKELAQILEAATTSELFTKTADRE